MYIQTDCPTAGTVKLLPKVTIKEGEDESLLAENRRVEFHIVRQDPPETKLDLRKIIKQPRDGQPLRSIIPKPSRKNLPTALTMHLILNLCKPSGSQPNLQTPSKSKSTETQAQSEKVQPQS